MRGPGSRAPSSRAISTLLVLEAIVCLGITTLSALLALDKVPFTLRGPSFYHYHHYCYYDAYHYYYYYICPFMPGGPSFAGSPRRRAAPPCALRGTAPPRANNTNNDNDNDTINTNTNHANDDTYNTTTGNINDINNKRARRSARNILRLCISTLKCKTRRLATYCGLLLRTCPGISKLS